MQILNRICRFPAMVIFGLFLLTLVSKAGQAAEGLVRGRLTARQVAHLVDQCRTSRQMLCAVEMKISGNEILFDVRLTENPDENAWIVQLNLPPRKYREFGRRYESSGYTLQSSDSVRLQGKRYYSGIWFRQPQLPQPLVLPDEPRPVTGQENPGFADLERYLLSFLNEHNVAGATFAVARDGEIVYSRGFGWADVEQRRAMQPDSVMRIASLSKPVTAAAVMTLVDQGKLVLDEPVLPQLKLRRRRKPQDVRWQQITARHLLQHRGGWEFAEDADPMFRSDQARKDLNLTRPPQPRDMIQWQLHQPLRHDPGSTFAYCNLGFCVLGRLVESVSRQSLSDYLQENVLEPAGMTQTRYGRTRKQDRADDEVCQYMQNNERVTAVWSVTRNRRGQLQPEEVDRPYGAWDMSVLDSCAGLVSSAPDLLRFLQAVFDGNDGLISADLRSEMLDRPANAVHGTGWWYSGGWYVQEWTPGRRSVWHLGKLDGTSCLMVRTADGWSWVMLMNTDVSARNGEQLAKLLERPLYSRVPR